MTENHPTAPPATVKPAKPSKPRPDFPLFPHAAGVWAKKIRGKMHYFGPWENPDGALAKYLEQKDALHAGRKPRADPEALIVKDLCNAFLNAKQALVDAGELARLTWGDYKSACVEIVAAFGKTRLVGDLGPDDFAAMRNRMVKKWGHHRLSKTIQFVRCVFKHAYDAGLIDRPSRFGPGFKRPSKKTIRLHRAKQGPKLFTAEEIRRLLDAAGVQMKAMIFWASTRASATPTAATCRSPPRTSTPASSTSRAPKRAYRGAASSGQRRSGRSARRWRGGRSRRRPNTPGWCS